MSVSYDTPVHTALKFDDEEAHGPTEAMGVASSKAAAKGMVISFDALGTLYTFREPLPKQYLNVARKCGFKAPVELPLLEKSFRSAFKSINSELPNYGKGTLNDPEAWWTKLVEQSFNDLGLGEQLPEDLGSSMYKHFSSSAAYELYPDVKPFLETMHAIRSRYQGSEDPMIMLGVITNSDPRVRNVLQSMNLRVGSAKLPKTNFADEMLRTSNQATEFRRTGIASAATPWHDYWNPLNDFDFLTTSYEAGYEKPDKQIFVTAWRTAALLPISRAEQQVDGSSNMFSATMAMAKSSFGHLRDIDNMSWIHVGDDFTKDYVGAEQAGFEALHLVRPGEGQARDGMKTVSSLDEVAAIVNIMISEQFNEKSD